MNSRQMMLLAAVVGVSCISAVSAIEGVMSAQALADWKAAGPDFSSTKKHFLQGAKGEDGAWVFAVGAMPTTLDQPWTFFQFVQVCTPVSSSLQFPRWRGSAPALSAL